MLTLKVHALYQEYKNGDKAAFDKIYNLVYPYLFSRGFRYLGHRSDIIEDAISTTMVRVWEHLRDERYDDSGTNSGKLLSWIYVIFRNICVDMSTENSKCYNSPDMTFYQSHHTEDEIEVDTGNTCDCSIEKIDHELYEQVVDLANRMNMAHRDVIIKYYRLPVDQNRHKYALEQPRHNIKQLSEQTGINPNTIKTNLRAFRTYVMKELKDSELLEYSSYGK